MHTNDWSFRPNGLGQLHFGMTREEVRAFDEIYGAVESVRSQAYSEEVLKILEDAMANMTSDQREEFREDTLGHQEFMSHVITEYLTSGLQLGFYDGRLYEIKPVPTCKEFNVNGVHVYKRGTKFNEILQALADVLQENPVVKAGDYVFVKSHTSFGRDDDDRSLSIMWSDRPRNLKSEDFSGYKELKLI